MPRVPVIPWPVARDALERARGRGWPRRRSLWALGLAILGLALSREVAPGFAAGWWFALASALVGAGVLVRGRAWTGLAAAGLVALAAGWGAARLNERPAGSVAWALAAEAGPRSEPILATLTGIVRDAPLPVRGGRGALGAYARTESACGFTLALTGVAGETGPDRRASGDVRVRVGAPPDALPAWVRPGAAVRATGRLRPPPEPLNPGEPDWRALAVQEGRVGDLAVDSPALLREDAARGPWDALRARWWAGAGALRARCASALDAALPGDASGADAADPAPRSARALMGSLLLGERDAGGDADAVSGAFGRLGLVHLVAISGFNLGVMAVVAMALLRLTGDRGWIEPAGVALLVGLYLLVLPAQASIVRAGALVLALLLADALGRRYDRATLTGWIGVAALAVRPLDAWSLGFQLSFGVVLALLLLGDVAHARLWGVPLRGLAPTYLPARSAAPEWLARAGPALAELLKRQVTASLLAWAVATPLIAFHTGQVAPLAPLTTLLVLPLTALVLWAGYLVLLAGVLMPAAAAWSGRGLEALGSLLAGVVLGLDRHAGWVVHLPRLSLAWALAATALAVWCVHHAGRRSWRGRLAVPGAAAIGAWLCAELWALPALRPAPALRVDTLAVGDGSCHLIRVGAGRGGGEALLWDCGSLRTGVGERLVPQAVRALGAWRVRTVVVTHAHIDHYAGLPDAAGPLGVERVLAPPQLLRDAERRPAGGAAALVRALRARGVRVEPLAAGGALTVGAARAEVRWPPPDAEPRNPNDHSLVAMFTVPTAGGDRRVLMTGDAARDALAAMLPEEADDAARAAWRADVLELPHHGAFVEPAAHLVDLADPLAVLQSTGPRRAADQRWTPWMRGRVRHITATGGAAWVEIGRDGSVTTGSRR